MPCWLLLSDTYKGSGVRSWLILPGGVHSRQRMPFWLVLRYAGQFLDPGSRALR